MPNWREDVVLTTEEATQYLKISKPTLLKHVRLVKDKALGWAAGDLSNQNYIDS